MAVTIEAGGGNLRILRLKGLLRKAELDAVLATETRQWRPTTHVKVLLILEDFKGWEHGANWGDTTFFETHGDQIDKIAIVADPKWEAEMLAFVGAGFRRAPVKFFSANEFALAWSWLG
jgi:hypothetical protein